MMRTVERASVRKNWLSRVSVGGAVCAFCLSVSACGESDSGDKPGGEAGAPGAAGGSAEPEEQPGTRLPPEDAQKVSLPFQVLVGQEEFACDRSFSAVGASALKVQGQDARFYVSEVFLLDAEGKRVPVELETREPWQAEGVTLLDFEDGTGLCEVTLGTAGMNREVTGWVPPGSYRGLGFTVGVPEELNHKNPIEQPAPLKASSMTWGWLMGLKFTKLELKQEDGEGVGFFHLGSTECEGSPAAGTISCKRGNRVPVLLEEFQLDESVVTLDLAQLFSGVDLSQDAQCHSGPEDEDCVSPALQLGIDWETGKIDGGLQQIFRVDAKD